MCSAGLVQQSENPTDVAGLPLSASSFSVHAAAGSHGAETWKIASRDLAFLFQAPSSLTEVRCVLCVRKN